MDKEFQDIIASGYNEIKTMIKGDDGNRKVFTIEPISKYLNDVDAIINYYIREYEKREYKHEGIGLYYIKAYSIIKSLMHMRCIYIDDEEANNIFKNGGGIPRTLLYANEILCWSVLIKIYEKYIINKCDLFPTEEYAPFCERHFEDAGISVVTTLYRSRNRLSDITPGYIDLLFDLLKQKHLNVSADLVGKLLNRSGFMVYMDYYSQMPGTLALMCCDLDKFKQVNDDNSHAVGDMVLRELADVLIRICKNNKGVPARVGGEEFWIAFYTPTQVNIDTEKERLLTIFKELQNELVKIKRPNANPLCVANKEYKNYMTMSVAGGVCPISAGYDDEFIGLWFDQLDEGVRQIKESGRDNFIYIRLSSSKRASWAMGIESSL